jgi:cytoskeletal protein CcmA (bactofilin family)
MVFGENVEITFSGEQGSPTLFIRSRGGGTQRYSLRVTNNQDSHGAGSRRLIVRNEDVPRDELVLDPSGAIALSGDLTVSGDIHASNDIEVSGDVRLVGADCAEDFGVDGPANPGAVVIITEEGRLRLSSQAYDRRVAGVISGAGDYRPGIVLDQQRPSSEKRLPVALIGKVYCRVDADQRPIAVGDLLTTSPTLGHAMKAHDPAMAFGAVIGKALRSLDGGKGLIPILVALQ